MCVYIKYIFKIYGILQESYQNYFLSEANWYRIHRTVLVSIIVCVCVGTYMQWVHLCVTVCGGQSTTLSIIAEVLSALILETGSFTDVELTDYPRLTVHRWPFFLMSLLLQRRNDENHSTAFLCGFWVIILVSSYS